MPVSEGHSHALRGGARSDLHILPDGAIGIDAGMTLTKIARAGADGVTFEAYETPSGSEHPPVLAGGSRIGVTGALVDRSYGDSGAVRVQEIEAAARGVSALLGPGEGADFVLALLGTGTAFAAVRGASVTHLGGTPLGGGSFSGIARRMDPTLSYDAMIAGAERGDRRRVDAMIADIYPEGIGRVGPDLTAAHLSHAQAGSQDDFLAGLLNLHAENIAQIAASRAVIATIPRIVVAGGFAHNNPSLSSAMTAMARLFGVTLSIIPSPGFAGALGAALLAAEADGTM